MTPILLVVAAASPARGQVDPGIEARVDSIFRPWDRPDSPGAAVGIVRDGRFLFTGGYGLADLEHDIPITPSTRFHVASEAKQFTAVAVLLLAERGALDLEDDVRAWLPELPDFGFPITLRHLLNHASGLRDQWQALALAGRYGDDAITTADVLRMIERQRELNFEPGSTELYCNTGFTLLAEVVSRASGRSFRDFTREEIFEPLGMTATFFVDDLREVVPGRARSYGVDESTGSFERRILHYAVPGATSLSTTVEDMLKWLVELERPRLRSRAFYAPLHARDTLNRGEEVVWGYGMNVGEHRGHLRYGHGGGDAGFRAWSVRFPEHDLGVVVLANLAAINPGPFGDALGLRVADLFLPESADAADDREGVDEESGTDFGAFVGSYGSAGDRIVNVTGEYGTLEIWEPGQEERTQLVPVGERVFVSRADSAARVEFETREGRVSGIRLEDLSGSWRGERVDPVPPEGLGSYAGSYHSEELETTWTLGVEDGTLVARHLMHEAVPLEPVVRDLLRGHAWFMREVRFTRDDAGVVNGLFVTAGRIRNVRFTRRKPRMGSPVR